MIDNMISRRGLLLAGASVAMAPAALSQTPSAGGGKVVKLLVGFPAGQATDLVARVLVERFNAATGDSFIVENRPGQGGSLALAQLAKSPANGTVMMIAHMSAVATNPHLYQSVAYDSLKDFEAVGLVGDLPFVLVCNPSLPLHNVSELIQYAKANPDKLTNASSGNGTVSHLAMEEIKRKAGLKITHIPYKGSVAGLTDVIAGNVSLALETASAVRPHVESGRLRALAAGSARRLNGSLASLPTLSEQGFADFTAVTWLMLLYPAGTPKAIVNATYATLGTITRNAEVEQKLISIGLQPRSSNSPEEATAYLRSEFKNWGDIVKRSGVQME
jgi:tripartite-type tricarboxylate transporter receptor subunit TctC